MSFSLETVARLLSTLALAFLSACVSIPPQVAQLHQKELEIIESLRKSHLALVDAYVDKRLAAFETFYFNTYSPAYLKNWKGNFRKVHGRDYDESKDFSVLSSDLTAEYLEAAQPLERIRADLKSSIGTEYAIAIESHLAIDRWIKSVGELQAANKAGVDRILGGIKPGLSLDQVDKALVNAKQALEAKLKTIL